MPIIDISNESELEGAVIKQWKNKKIPEGYIVEYSNVWSVSTEECPEGYEEVGKGCWGWYGEDGSSKGFSSGYETKEETLQDLLNAL